MHRSMRLKRVQFRRILRCLLCQLLRMQELSSELRQLRRRIRQNRFHLPEGMSLPPILRQQRKTMHRLLLILRHLLIFQLLHLLQKPRHQPSRRCLLRLPLPLRHLRRNRSLHLMSQWILLLPGCLPNLMPRWRQTRQRYLPVPIGHRISRSVRHQLRLRFHRHCRQLPTLQLQLRPMFRRHQQLHFLHQRIYP